MPTDLLTTSEREAIGRWNRHHAGEDFTAVYDSSGDGPNHSPYRFSEDKDLLAAALARVAPLLQAVGPLVEECRHVIGELVGPWEDSGRMTLGSLPKSKLTLAHVRAVVAAAKEQP